MVNLLLVTYWPYPHAGGVSTHMETLIEGLTELGHRTEVFSGTTVHQTIHNPALEDRPVSLEMKYRDLCHPFISNYALQIGLFESVARHLDFSPWDVICCQDVVSASVMRKLTNKPIVLTAHGYLAYEAMSEGLFQAGSKEERYMLDIERAGLFASQAVLSVDTRIRDYLVSQFGYKGPIKTMYNFINTCIFDGIDMASERKRIGIPADRFVIVSPRRMVPKNGVKYAIMAAQVLRETLPEALLICLGDGPEQPEIAQYIRQHGLEQHCYLAGAVGHQDVLRAIVAADVVLVPSVPSEGVEEATSIAALEGMGAAKAVVASRIGGLAELISHGVNGMLCQPGKPEEIASVIQDLYDHRGLMQTIGEQARQTIRQSHSHLAAANEYIQLCERALA